MPDFFIPTLAAPVIQKDVAKRVQGQRFGAKPQPLYEEKELCAFLRRLITQTQEHPGPKQPGFLLLRLQPNAPRASEMAFWVVSSRIKR